MSDTEQNPTLIYCDICDVSISGENNFNSHVLGKKHVKKSIAQRISKSGNSLTTTPASDHPWAEMMCNLYSESEEASSSKNYEERGNSTKSYQSTERKRKESKPTIEEDEDANPWKAMMSKMQDPDGTLTREYDQEEGELNDEDEYKMDQAERENHAKEIEEYDKACNACGPKLRCTCCGEVYSDPVRLSCGHLIDRGCAEAKRQFGLIVMCPMCKKRIYCKDVDALPTDNDIACQLPPPVRNVREEGDRGFDEDSDEYECDDDKRRKRRKKGKDKRKKKRQGRDYYDDSYSNNSYNYDDGNYDYNQQPTGFASVRRQNQAYNSDYDWERNNDQRPHPFTRQPPPQQSKYDSKPVPLMQGFREQDAMEALFGPPKPPFPPAEPSHMNQPFIRGPNPFVRSNQNYPQNAYQHPPGGVMQGNMMDGGFQCPPQNMNMNDMNMNDMNEMNEMNEMNAMNAGPDDRDSSLRDLLAQQQSIMRMIQETREAKVKLASPIAPSNDPPNNEMLKQQMELQRLREEVEDQKRQLAMQQKTLQEQLQLQQARIASQAAPVVSPSNSRNTLLPLPTDTSQMSAASTLTVATVQEDKSVVVTNTDKPTHANAIEQVTQLYQQAFHLYQKAVKAASVDGAESEASKQALKRYSEVYENLVALQNAASGAAKSASAAKSSHEPNVTSAVPSKSSDIPEKDSLVQLGEQSTASKEKDSFRESELQRSMEFHRESADSKSIIPFIHGYTEKPAVAGLTETSLDDQSDVKRARMDSGGTPSISSFSQADLEQSPYLLLSGLKVGIKATNVKEICAGFGRVVSIKIVGTRSGGAPQIYAYVTMDNAASATEAVRQISGKFFFGSQIDAKKIKSTPFAKK